MGTMSTATETLSWVTFSNDRGKTCAFNVSPKGIGTDLCGLEAVKQAIWTPTCCGQLANPMPLCIEHAEKVQALADSQGPRSGPGYVVHATCRTRLHLEAMERIK
jgi:hypothetical protein